MPKNGKAQAPHLSPTRRSLRPTNCTADQRKRELPVAEATTFRTFGRAKNDTVIVRRCPWCHFPHRHIGFEGTTGLFARHPSCKRSRTYLVRVVETVPAVADISVMPVQRKAS